MTLFINHDNDHDDDGDNDVCKNLQNRPIGPNTDLNKIIKCKQLVGKLLKCLQIQFQNVLFFCLFFVCFCLFVFFLFFPNCEINPF